MQNNEQQQHLYTPTAVDGAHTAPAIDGGDDLMKKPQQYPEELLMTGAQILAQPFLQRALSYPCGLRGDSNPGQCKSYGDYRMRVYWEDWHYKFGNVLPNTATFQHVEDFIRNNPELTVWAAEPTTTSQGKTPSLRDSKRKRANPMQADCVPDHNVSATTGADGKKQPNNFETSIFRGTPLRGLDRPSLSLKTKLKFPLIKGLMHVKKHIETERHLGHVRTLMAALSQGASPSAQSVPVPEPTSLQANGIASPQRPQPNGSSTTEPQGKSETTEVLDPSIEDATPKVDAPEVAKTEDESPGQPPQKADAGNPRRPPHQSADSEQKMMTAQQLLALSTESNNAAATAAATATEQI